MKKFLIILTVIAFVSINTAYGAGMVYDPTEFQIDETTNTIGTVKVPDASKINTEIHASTNLAQEAVTGQSDSFNNALFELDSAQVNIRNELLEYKAKYQEVDTQYRLIKEQRRVLAEQIRSVERKIKAIENSKKQIRKTML